MSPTPCAAHTAPFSYVDVTDAAMALQDMRGSASPKGEARREAPPSAGAAKRAAGRITGGGGRAV